MCLGVFRIVEFESVAQNSKWRNQNGKQVDKIFINIKKVCLAILELYQSLLRVHYLE